MLLLPLLLGDVVGVLVRIVYVGLAWIGILGQRPLAGLEVLTCNRIVLLSLLMMLLLLLLLRVRQHWHGLLVGGDGGVSIHGLALARRRVVELSHRGGGGGDDRL